MLNLPPSYSDSLREDHAADISLIQQRLSNVDWGFVPRAKAPLAEAIHPYPAKFIGDIPRALIQCLPIPPDTAVFDPFCGSGTTLLEAQRAGFESVGVDLNPIACLISRVKTSPLPPGFDMAAEEVAASAARFPDPPRPDIPNIDHWFKPEVQAAVSALAHTISERSFHEWSDLLRLTLSSILVRVSNQDSDTRYAAVDKEISGRDVFSAFRAAAAKLHTALLDRSWTLPRSLILEADTLALESADISDQIGAVITSPPYPNAYEYWLYHKYRMWWLGFDPLFVKEREIGARAHFFKKNHHTADLFYKQMAKAFSFINRKMIPGGFICIVVGRSKIHGTIVNNGDIIERLATDIGLEHVFRFEREIYANRKSFNLSHAGIKTESVLVFRKV